MSEPDPDPSKFGAQTGTGDSRMAGVALMAAGALTAPGNDTLAKYLSGWVAPVEIAFWRLGFQALFFGIAVIATRRSFIPDLRYRVLATLGVLVAVTLLAMIWAVSVMPVATTIAVFFVEPLILTLMASLFLGERSDWQRLLAVVAGLAGALIIIRPNWAEFGWASVLPLIAAISFAGYATVIRKSALGADPLVLQWWISVIAAGLAGLAIAALLAGGVVHLTAFAAPLTVFAGLGFLGLMTCVTFGLFTGAFRRAPAGLLAPLQYLEIASAAVLGYVVFGDLPDAMTWLGIAIILAAGLFVVHRERRASPVPAAPGAG